MPQLRNPRSGQALVDGKRTQEPVMRQIVYVYWIVELISYQPRHQAKWAKGGGTKLASCTTLNEHNRKFSL